MVYAFNENFMLPLRTTRWCTCKGRCSARCRATIGSAPPTCACCSPNVDASRQEAAFMGGEFGQRLEWNHEAALQWPLLETAAAQRPAELGGRPNALYRSRPALHAVDFGPEGFQWVDLHNAELSVIAFLRKARDAYGAVAGGGTSRRCRAKAIWWGCRVPAAGANALNSGRPQPPGGSGIGNLAAGQRSRWPRTATTRR